MDSPVPQLLPQLAVADWLVDEAGCPLPQEGEQGEEGQQAQACLWSTAAASSTGGGGVVAMRWLLRRGVPMQAEAIRSAAQAGRLESVQFLHGECGLQLTEEVLKAAVGSRSLPTAAWLLRQGCPVTPEAHFSAALAADVGMVRWLVQEAGCPLTGITVDMIACHWPSGLEHAGGLEQAVRLLVEAGCEMGGEGANVSRHGHVMLLRYLHDELRTPYGWLTLTAAARGGCEEVLEWMVDAKFSVGHGMFRSPYVSAGQTGDLASLSCLRRLGVPLGAEVLARAVDITVPLPALRWLVEQGAPWDEEAVARAVRAAREGGSGGRFETSLEWLEARLGAERKAAS